MNYSVKTFGCKVNTYDSSLIQKQFKSINFQNTKLASARSIHIVNTCAVTDEAVKEAVRWIRRYRRNNPSTYIAVTGCAAQVEAKIFSNLKEVDLVIANSHKAKLLSIIKNFLQSNNILNSDFYGDEKTRENDETNWNGNIAEGRSAAKRAKVFHSSIFKEYDLGLGGGVEASHSRLFLKIQDGCNSFCTFCVIPFARGKSRSISPELLLSSIQKHYEAGVREVVLTGVHIGDYLFLENGKQNNLAHLVQILLEKTKMPRFRLSSLEPIELSDELLDLYTDDRMCSHFHLSVQSADSTVLNKMKRKYTEKEVEDCLWKIYKKIPNAFVGMDIIAGFPEESKQQFNNTYMRLRDTPWTALHVFPYSPRRYTYAAKMLRQWPRSLIKKRSLALRLLSIARLKKEQKKQLGSVQAVLPLKHKNKLYHQGISRHYWKVEYPSKPANSSAELLVSIQSVNETTGHLAGHVVSSREI